MQEQEHTPGPWQVFTATDGHKIIGIGETSGEGVADCGFGIWRGGSAEAAANARLIAAAPELLEALRALTLAIDASAACTASIVVHAQHRAAAAIARALPAPPAGGDDGR